MRKFKFIKFLIFVLFALTFAHGAYGKISAITVSNISAQGITPVAAAFVVMKIELTDNGSGDTVNSIQVINDGTADSPNDISAMKFWYQASGTFNPAAATLVGIMTRSAARTWDIASLALPIVSGSSLYITADVPASASDGATIKIRLPKSKLVFAAPTGAYPKTADISNADTQVIMNPMKMLVDSQSISNPRVSQGQADSPFLRLNFRYTGAVSRQLTALKINTVNYSGPINANSVISKAVLKYNGTTYATLSSIPASPVLNIPLSTYLTIPAGGTAAPVDVYFDILPTANTYDVGASLQSVNDITLDLGTTTIEAYSGYAFPMACTKSVVERSVNSFNASANSLSPAFVSKGQADIAQLGVLVQHPMPVTEYAGAVLTGITLTVESSTSPSSLASDIISSVKVFGSGNTLAASSSIPLSGTVWVPFSLTATAQSGNYIYLTITASLNPSFTANNYRLGIQSVRAAEGNTGALLTQVSSFPYYSGYTSVQSPATAAVINHANRMPVLCVRGQQWVHAEDITVASPDPSGYAGIEVRGITLTCEDDVANPVIPSSVIEKVTILDMLNNTLASYSSIPSSGNRLYVDFPQALTMNAASSNTFRVYLDIKQTATAGNFIRLSLPAASYLNAVDKNSKASLPVSAAGTDPLPQKTSASRIMDPAIDIKAKHTGVMPADVNAGQQDVSMMKIYLANDLGGIVSVSGLRFTVYDQAYNQLPTNSVISRVKVDNASNTSLVYADTAVNTNSASYYYAFSTPVSINQGASNAVTLTIKADIAQEASTGFFIRINAASFIDSRDAASGLTVTAAPLLDSFPMDTTAVNIETRANTLNASYTGTNSGSANKGEANVRFMDISFCNPAGAGYSDLYLAAVTLTAEDSVSQVNAGSFITAVRITEKNNTSNVYASLTQTAASPFMFVRFSQNILITPGEAGRVTFTVVADISSAAISGQYRLNLKNASDVAAFDSNEMKPVTVTACAGYSFPDMRSGLIDVISINTLSIGFTPVNPAFVSGGQTHVNAAELRFSNASDAPMAITGVTVTVKDSFGNPVDPSSVMSSISIIDSNGVTGTSMAVSSSAEGKVYMTFGSYFDVPASSAITSRLIADVRETTFTASVTLGLDSTAMVEALPSTITVQADTGTVYPAASGIINIQLKPVYAGLSHTDVIPTTVSTGQTDIFAEILSISNPNLPGTAEVQLKGLTLTVADDTNTVIAPSRALKRIMVRDDSEVYVFYASIPSSAASFYVPFDTPVTVPVSQVKDLKLMADIVDTLQTGSFLINLTIDADVEVKDKNSNYSVPVIAVNGDSFPMKTSTVILQEKAVQGTAGYTSLSPVSANIGQQNVSMLKLTISNTGSINSANELITRLVLAFDDGAGGPVNVKNTLGRISIRNQAGSIYGEITAMPDSTDTVSIGLTTPVTIKSGIPQDVYIYCDISPMASPQQLRAVLKTASSVTLRDANSYNLINVIPESGYSFPMASGSMNLQLSSELVYVSASGLLPAAVGKGALDVPAMYIKIRNPSPSQYSSIAASGITVTVQNISGLNLNASSVISSLKLSDNGTVCGYTGEVGLSPYVYVPLTISPVSIPPDSYKALTLYASVLPATGELYLQFGINSGADVNVNDMNDGSQIGAIGAEAGFSYPIRSGYTTIISPPGVRIYAAEYPALTVTAGVADIKICGLSVMNDGSYYEDLLSITLTARDSTGNLFDPGLVMSALRIVDNSGTTIPVSVSFGAAGKVYVNIQGGVYSVPPQDTAVFDIYCDTKTTTFAANFRLSLESDTHIGTAGSPVSVMSGYALPFNSSAVHMYAPSSGLQADAQDLMPPSVSTSQSDVYAMRLTFENQAAAGYSSVHVNALTVSVKDSAGADINAAGVISAVRLTDGSVTFGSVTAPAGAQIYIKFSEPLIVPAAAAADLYVSVDITGNTQNPLDGFKLSLGAASDIGSQDANSGDTLAVAEKAGFSLPFETSYAQLQKRIPGIMCAYESVAPAFVSSAQMEVPVLNIVLSGSGEAGYSSAMVTRINIYSEDEASATINASAVMSAVKITNGKNVVGSVPAPAGHKTTINLTSPVIVPAGETVTLTVKADIKAAYLLQRFALYTSSSLDLYCLDANSYSQIQAFAAPGYPFPMKSGVMFIEERAASIDLAGPVNTAPAAVTKSQDRVALFAFTVDGPLNTLTASVEFNGLTVTVKDVSDNIISASSALNMVYVIDSSGSTLGSSAAGVSGQVPVKFASPYALAPGTAVHVTVFARIASNATVSEFKAEIGQNQYISLTDENSGYEVVKNSTIPWSTSGITVYDAPATDLKIWHDGSMAPGLVGISQPNLKFMSLSMYNPGGQGTAAVRIHGITLTAVNAANSVIAPDLLMSNIRLTDFTMQEYYGGVTPSGSVAAPFYVPFNQPVNVPASNTVTVYIAADISPFAAQDSFRLGIMSGFDVNASNTPAGYVTVTAKSGDAFPMQSALSQVTAITYIVKTGHRNLMPVSASDAQLNIEAMELKFENENSSVMEIKGLTITVKGIDGMPLTASESISGMRVMYGSFVAGTAASLSGSLVYIELNGATIPAYSEIPLIISVSLKGSGSKPFSLELALASHVRTLPVANVQPGAGDYFGNMSTNTVSVQPSDLEKSFHAFPNPFNPSSGKCRIEYYLAVEAEVTIKIFTLSGVPVKTIIEKALKSPGLHNEDGWDARNTGKEAVLSGVYMCVIQVKDSAGKKTKLTGKIAVLR